MYHIVRYKDTRYWAALHHNGKLLAVVVYKKGVKALSKHWNKSSLTPSLTHSGHVRDQNHPV